MFKGRQAKQTVARFARTLWTTSIAQVLQPGTFHDLANDNVPILRLEAKPQALVFVAFSEVHHKGWGRFSVCRGGRQVFHCPCRCCLARMRGAAARMQMPAFPIEVAPLLDRFFWLLPLAPPLLLLLLHAHREHPPTTRPGRGLLLRLWRAGQIPGRLL